MTLENQNAEGSRETVGWVGRLARLVEKFGKVVREALGPSAEERNLQGIGLELPEDPNTDLVERGAFFRALQAGGTGEDEEDLES